MNVVIIGAGYVGVTTAVNLAELGHHVTVVELDQTRREALNQGTPAFYEPGLEEALAPLVTGEQAGPGSPGTSPSSTPSIQAIGDIQQAPPSEVILLCVGTPQDEDGSADLTQVQAAAEDAARALQTWEDTFTVVATKSTVPPGTGRDIVAPALEQHVGTIGEHVGLGSNPEFLREGNALEDARNPDRIVLGASDERSARVLRQLYEVDGAHDNGAPGNGAPDCPIVTTTIETAETIKYAANALLATKIAFANELANLCEPLGVNVDEVVHATGLDKRINASFLQAGVGFGGSCFPKDLAALASVGRQHGVDMGILNAALANNERQPLRILEMARETLGEDLTGKRIALLGLSFKPGTSDVRETRALPIYQALTEAGAEVVCCDPIAGEAFAALVEATGAPAPTVVEDATVALDQAHACILQTAWPEFGELEPATFTKLMAEKPVVLDGRRALDAQALEAAGITYRAIGRGDLSTVPPQGDPQR